MEHDDHGCRHSTCPCEMSQRKMMRNGPEPEPSREEGYGVLDIKVWLYTREYPSMPANTLFSAISKSLQGAPFLKVWKVDDDGKYINMTTHSIRLDPKVRYHQVEVDLQVTEGKDPSSSVVNFRIIPTLTGIVSKYELFTNVDVNEKFARYVANLIFGAIEEGRRRF